MYKTADDVHSRNIGVIVHLDGFATCVTVYHNKRHLFKTHVSESHNNRCCPPQQPSLHDVTIVACRSLYADSQLILTASFTSLCMADAQRLKAKNTTFLSSRRLPPFSPNLQRSGLRSLALQYVVLHAFTRNCCFLYGSHLLPRAGLTEQNYPRHILRSHLLEATTCT